MTANQPFDIERAFLVFLGMAGWSEVAWAAEGSGFRAEMQSGRSPTRPP